MKLQLLNSIRVMVLTQTYSFNVKQNWFSETLTELQFLWGTSGGHPVQDALHSIQIKYIHLEQVAQNCIQVVLNYLQGRRLSTTPLVF